MKYVLALACLGMGISGCGQGSAQPPAAVPTIDLMAFGSFDYVERMKLPDEIQKWSGKRVRARGLMNPGRSLRDLPEFELVKDRASCCFGTRPKMNHFVQVTLRPGATVDYQPDYVTVEGNLVVEDRWDGDWQLGLYWMDDAVVVP